MRKKPRRPQREPIMNQPFIFEPLEKGYSSLEAKQAGEVASWTYAKTIKGAPGNYERGRVYWMHPNEARDKPWFREPFQHEADKVEKSKP